MGVYAAMSVAGGAVGLIAGGLLTTYASWRWVLFRSGSRSPVYRHALATGFSRGFEVAAGILLLAVAVAVSVIRARRDGSAAARAPAS